MPLRDRTINTKLGEGRSTDALDSIALSAALEFPMLINDGRASGAVVGSISYALDTDPVPSAILRGALKLLPDNRITVHGTGAGAIRAAMARLRARTFWGSR